MADWKKLFKQVEIESARKNHRRIHIVMDSVFLPSGDYKANYYYNHKYTIVCINKCGYIGSRYSSVGNFNELLFEDAHG